MKVSVQIEHITPKAAAELLANKLEAQRPVRKTWSDELTRQMIDGDFKLSSDAILIICGQLGNGQHRLTAVVNSKITQPFIVMRTDDEELYRLIDSGIKRTVADAISGRSATDVAAIANKVMQYDVGMLTTMGQTKTRERMFTRAQLIEFIEEKRDALNSAAGFVRSEASKNNILQTSIAGALVIIAARVDGERPKQFVHSLYAGDTKDDAIWDFRERLIRQRMSKEKMNQSYVFALAIKAYNAWRSGQRPGSLRCKEGEAFPTVATN